MSIHAHLIHRCTLERATSQPKPYGGETLTWSDWRVDMACRLVIDSQRVLDTAQAASPRVTRYRLLLPAGTAVQEGDRVTGLTYEDGSEVSERFSVEAILPRRGWAVKHITCELKRVS